MKKVISLFLVAVLIAGCNRTADNVSSALQFQQNVPVWASSWLSGLDNVNPEPQSQKSLASDEMRKKVSMEMEEI
ncbi:MAG: hypothetical protein LE169_01680 [Endomicrobium sp.]|nr:hypothetical protein [Endomicrobium sp.]